MDPADYRRLAGMPVSEIMAENERLRAILTDFVRETDAWNASMAKLIGKPPGYCWQTLERAREALK